MPTADTSTPTAYPRPVPIIGDTSSAAERAANPAGWAFSDEHVAAFDAVLSARRDIRKFRPDPLPDNIIEEILTAGHRAPSVGMSQPWRFVLVTDQAIRDRAALMADQARLAQAAAMEPDSARRLLDLQLDGIRESPLAVVLCCDRRTPPVGVLGRATFSDADMWSCACAIQNMWLAARARGVGMGWVTLFDPTELAALVGAPDGVETLGWLCFGYPDERPPTPGLERHGWARRTPLHDIVFHNSFGTNAEPPTDHSTSQQPTSERLGPNADHVVSARDTGDVLLTPPGSLGVLDRAIDRLVACGAPTRGVLHVALADHPVADLGVTAFQRSVNADVLRACHRDESLCATAASAQNLQFQFADCGAADGDILHADALTRTRYEQLVTAATSAGEAISNTVVAIGEACMGNTTTAAAVACALLDVDPHDVVGLGASSDSAMVARKRDVVEQALRRNDAAGGWREQPGEALRRVGGPDLAYLAAFVAAVARPGNVVVLDGFATTIAAYAAVLDNPSVAQYLIAGQRSRERAHPVALSKLGLEPLLDMRFRCGEGVGAAMAARCLMDGYTIRQRTATTTPTMRN